LPTKALLPLGLKTAILLEVMSTLAIFSGPCRMSFSWTRTVAGMLLNRLVHTVYTRIKAEAPTTRRAGAPTCPKILGCHKKPYSAGEYLGVIDLTPK
jgi:hypothetical protein